MLSNIRKMTISTEVITIVYTDNTELEIYGNIEEVFKDGMSPCCVYENGNVYDDRAEVKYHGDYLIIGSCLKPQFFPHEMYRAVMKDFNKGRVFDLSYRKHFVYDYSKDQYNLVIPKTVDDKVLEAAKLLIREHSTGKVNKPTGVVMSDCVVVIKGDSNYTYPIKL